MKILFCLKKKDLIPFLKERNTEHMDRSDFISMGRRTNVQDDCFTKDTYVAKHLFSI